MRNLPLGFGLVLAGAVLVERGWSMFGSSFGGGGDAAAATAAPTGGGGGLPHTNGSAAANQRLARALIAARYPQWASDPRQWVALVRLWTQESGWEDKTNPSSGARGIPQALPASKLGAVGQGHGPTAIRAQIIWGLNYIHDRYGSPAAAWQHEQSAGWY